MGGYAEKAMKRREAASPTVAANRVLGLHGDCDCGGFAKAVGIRISAAKRAASMAGLDGAFASHTALTLAHILPALAFVLIAPLVVFRKLEKVRWAESFVYPLGVVVGLTAYAMSTFAVGGWVERSAVLVFDTLFLFSLGRSYLFMRAGNAVVATEMAVASDCRAAGDCATRPVMGVFFATSAKTHLRVEQFFGIAFWIGFSINVLIFEVWIRRRDRRLVNG